MLSIQKYYLATAVLILTILPARADITLQSGGADNESYSTEPFAIKTTSGKIYWLVVKADYGYFFWRVLIKDKVCNGLRHKL